LKTLVPRQTISQQLPQTLGEQAFVRGALAGKRLPIFFSPEDTIEQIKQYVFEKTGIPVCEQRITYAGHELANARTLGSYSVKANEDLCLVLCGRGGGKDVSVAKRDMNFAILATDHKMVKDVLRLSEFDVIDWLQEMEPEEFADLNAAAQKERNGDRVLMALVPHVKELQDLEETCQRLKERLEVAREYTKDVMKRSLCNSNYYDETAGVEVKKLKTLLSGIMTVKSSAVRKSKKSRTTSPDADRKGGASGSADGSARRGLFNWI
jgi:hypothetical protein